MLWFDVEKKNYTTMFLMIIISNLLWFDVEKKNYTTTSKTYSAEAGCGLM